jgi:cytochrome c biogenesis protein CcmG/thiol:disulfide interchange protein DsbE
MNWKRSLIGLAIALPIIALLVNGLRQNPRALPSTMPGKDAPTFALPMLEADDTIRLADHRGEVVVLNFWASWCLPCRVEHPDLLQAARLYQARGVRFYGLLYNDIPRNALAWLDELGSVYPSLLDDGTRTAIDYGVTAVPETFVIDRSGKVRFKKVGPVELAELRQVIEPILRETSPTAAAPEARQQ